VLYTNFDNFEWFGSYDMRLADAPIVSSDFIKQLVPPLIAE